MSGASPMPIPDPRQEPPGGDVGSVLTDERPAAVGRAPRRPILTLFVLSLCLVFVPLLFAMFGDALIRAFFESPIRVLGPIVVLVPFYFFVAAIFHRRRSR